jgi:hypothetical protein
MTFDVEMLNCLPIDTFLPILLLSMLYNGLGLFPLTSSIEYTSLSIQQVRDASSKSPYGRDPADYPPSQRETPQRPIRHVRHLLASLPSLLHVTGRVGVLGGALEYFPLFDSGNQHSNGIEFQLHGGAFLCRNLRTKSSTFRMSGFFLTPVKLRVPGCGSLSCDLRSNCCKCYQILLPGSYRASNTS